MPDGIPVSVPEKRQRYVLHRLHIKVESFKRACSLHISRINSSGFRYCIAKSNEFPAAIELNAGKGKVTVLASPYGVTEQPQCELPVKVMEEKPLDKPYPILNHTKALMEDIFYFCATV